LLQISFKNLSNKVFSLSFPKLTLLKTDNIFKQPKNAEDFKFGNTVVQVFDDMVTRSVPFYLEIQRMMTEITTDFAVPGTRVYDLGCSTGKPGQSKRIFTQLFNRQFINYYYDSKEEIITGNFSEKNPVIRL